MMPRALFSRSKDRLVNPIQVPHGVTVIFKALRPVGNLSGLEQVVAAPAQPGRQPEGVKSVQGVIVALKFFQRSSDLPYSIFHFESRLPPFRFKSIVSDFAVALLFIVLLTSRLG